MDTTNRIQRPDLLALMHQMLENDLATKRNYAPTIEAESDRVTAVISTPPRHDIILTAVIGFVGAFIAGFAAVSLVV